MPNISAWIKAFEKVPWTSRHFVYDYTVCGKSFTLFATGSSCGATRFFGEEPPHSICLSTAHPDSANGPPALRRVTAAMGRFFPKPIQD
jgi:hypothetical protein